MQNLWTLFAHAKLPPELHSIVSLYKKRFQIKIHGTLLEDFGQQHQVFQVKKQGKGPCAQGTSYYGQRMHKLYLRTFCKWIQTQTHSSSMALPNLGNSSRAMLLSYIELFGRRFQPGKGGNSYVLVQQSDHHSWIPGHLVSIISLSCNKKENIGQCYAVLRIYQSLSEQDEAQDPYQQLPHCGYLVYEDFEPEYTVLPVSNLRTHFACTAIQVPGIVRNCQHVLALSL